PASAEPTKPTAPAPAPAPAETPARSAATTLQGFARALRVVADNWQVLFAGIVLLLASWLWILRPESEVSAGRMSPEEYMSEAAWHIRRAGGVPMPRGARAKAAHLLDALMALEAMEKVHGIPDKAPDWYARVQLGRVRVQLARLRREHFDDVADMIEDEPGELLPAAVLDYRQALAMRSPREVAEKGVDKRSIKVDLAGALNDLGEHAEAVRVLSPLVWDLRRDEADDLIGQKERGDGVTRAAGTRVGKLSEPEMRIHMAMARSLRGRGRIDEAERHYSFVADAGSGRARARALMGLGDSAVIRALASDPPDTAALEAADARYSKVYEEVFDPSQRAAAGLRLGSVRM
ncbi:unnamed protein product, partial [marine sediment metagenome]